jgi:hypothetical protein
MVKLKDEEETIKFDPFIDATYSKPSKTGRSRFSFYKMALFVQDLLALNLTFVVFAWIAGVSPLPRQNLALYIELFMPSLVVIAFFPTYHLYSHHFIFMRQNHLLNIVKSGGWGLLTLSLTPFLYVYSGFLAESSGILLTGLAGIGLLLMSRSAEDYILNLLRSVGLSFLVTGLIAITSAGKKPVIMDNWFVALIGISLGVCAVLVARSLLVHLIFNDWTRRHFRRQIVII